MISEGLGFLTVAISVIFWGSNFIPVKKFPTGDGVFFQWVLCSGIWTTGLIVHLSRGAPPFEPLVLVGGIVWATGNILTVPIVKLLGLGIGILLWGESCLLMGWATGRFGFFGLKAQSVSIPSLNYVGVVLAIISGFCYLFVKPNVQDVDAVVELPEDDQVRQKLTPTQSRKSNPTEEISQKIEKEEPVSANQKGAQQSWASRTKLFFHMDEHLHLKHKMMHWFHLDQLNIHPPTEKDHIESVRGHCLPLDTSKMSNVEKRLIGGGMAIFSGIMYGLNFTPTQYILDHNDGSKSSHAIDYTFSHFSGIYLASTFYFLAYSALKRNKPEIYPHVAIPAFISGIMWAIAQTCFFCCK